MAKLYIVPTPIGNLEDITLRAIKVLEAVDVILCEDTRRTKKLTNHIGINCKLQSHHKFNEHKQVKLIVKNIKNGMNVALVSDAGTPGISDPGFLITRECLNNGIEIECLPGPTAFIPALLSSGFSTDRFIFEGFLPTKKGRKTRLSSLSQEKRTIIFYESPHKLIKTLNDFKSFFGSNRRISISRELTKIYEETLTGSIKEICQIFFSKKPKGEFVIVVEGKDK